MQRDSVTGDVKSTTLATGVPYTSEIPTTYNVTISKHFGPSLIAADVERGIFDTTIHVGAERWFGPMAVRAGSSLDGQQQLQFGGGGGVKFGRFGADLGIATNSRNLSHERGVELSLGLALYH